MNKIIVITLLSFFIFSCSNSENQEKTEETVTVVAQDDHAGHDHDGHDHDEVTHHKASPLSQYLGIWSYDAVTHKRDYYKNRWIEFKADGTFENGVGAKQTNTGHWSLDSSNTFIDLNFKDNSVEQDEQWKVQINPPILLLLGNSPKNTTGAQMKLSLIDERPKE